ncbi:Putative monooxygenase ydhR [Providencia rustigianii]|uniref:Mono-oxygenase ydhR n=1 Tax=Providencia rustigianii DSM 4541 TaxID=500637 RepID=D1P0Y3_9GAMM|nr:MULTISPECIES: monooxygenase [Providencia]EFB73002.1 putative mono-oxygenase ydhR [Providencia rustigianii DSM 4541]MTC56908.1 monooxygenase [Providencia rustigianii]SUC25275.1 Putative monooxygenase ydhR [Providencia rustigianii]VEB63143.1 Putative monooxygenase ydhR [Providencia rustigianii]
MQVILQVDFPYQGPWGDEMTAAMDGLAQSINQEPGFIWKIWTENQQTQRAGGIYLFANQTDAQAYLEMHSARLKSFGVPEVSGQIFSVNTALSQLNQAQFIQK